MLTEWVSGELYNKFKSICDRLGLDTRKKIYMRGKWDSETPHTESKLKKVIGDYSGRHGSMMTMQSSHSPLTNTCNAAFFPALAKKGTAPPRPYKQRPLYEGITTVGVSFESVGRISG